MHWSVNVKTSLPIEIIKIESLQRDYFTSRIIYREIDWNANHIDARESLISSRLRKMEHVSDDDESMYEFYISPYYTYAVIKRRRFHLKITSGKIFKKLKELIWNRTEYLRTSYFACRKHKN